MMTTSADDLLAGAGFTPPAPAEADPFADSPVSERVVHEAMRGRWLWTPGLGWMAWSGQVWEARPDAAAAEAVRQWIDAEVARIALQGDRQRTSEAAALQSENRIARVLRLCRGQVLAATEDFDQDPDLLVCANGVVDLRTGELMEHDPGRLVTRMTKVDYNPDAGHCRRRSKVGPVRRSSSRPPVCVV
jgi:phage/plasmid-associated DNA primase